MTFVPTYDPYGRQRSPCKLCGVSANYTFNIPGSGQYALCSTHANKLEGITKQPPQFDKFTALSLKSASSDLEEACSLDPYSSNIKENAKNVKDMMERFKVAITLAEMSNTFFLRAS